MVAKSRAERVLPRTKRDNRLNPDPSRMNCRMLTLLPTCKKSTTEMLLPILKKLRMLADDAKWM
jgi:hypothetical protein